MTLDPLCDFFKASYFVGQWISVRYKVTDHVEGLVASNSFYVLSDIIVGEGCEVVQWDVLGSGCEIKRGVWELVKY